MISKQTPLKAKKINEYFRETQVLNIPANSINEISSINEIQTRNPPKLPACETISANLFISKETITIEKDISKEKENENEVINFDYDKIIESPQSKRSKSKILKLA